MTNKDQQLLEEAYGMTRKIKQPSSAKKVIADYFRKVLDIGLNLSSEENKVLEKAMLDGSDVGNAISDYFEAINKVRRVSYNMFD